MSIIHKIKVFLKSIKWYFELLNFARTHAKEVDNYIFLIETRNKAYTKFLEIERKEGDKEKLDKLKAQIEIIDKILNYVHK